MNKGSTPERDRAIILARRGGYSLTRIGREHNLTRSRVQQIVKQAAKRQGMAGTPASELTARLRNAIRADGCAVLPSSVAGFYTMKTLVRVPNIGAKSILELQVWLLRHGEKQIK